MRISVTLTTHNGQRWLARQLRSLVAQDRLPDELVAIDDNSTDASVSILREFASSAPFAVRIEVQPQRHGLGAAISRAIEMADGDVIFPCDQDDVWHPEKIARLAGAFEAETYLDLIFSDADVVDEDLRPLGYTLWNAVGFTPRRQHTAKRGGLSRILVKFNVVTGAAMAFSARRKPLILPISASWVHDGWIGVLLAMAGKCRWISQPLLAYRQRPGQLIGAPRRSWRQQLAFARKMDADYFANVSDGYQQCLDRLKNERIDRVHQLLLREKICHCQARRDLRLHGSIQTIFRELFSGRYSRASLGWKSAAQDLLEVCGIDWETR